MDNIENQDKEVLDVVALANDIYSGTGKDGEQILEMEECLIGIRTYNFARDSKIILDEYKSMFETKKTSYGGIPSVEELCYKLSDKNLDICRCMAMYEYEEDEALNSEACNNALMKYRALGMDEPSDNQELFFEIYSDEEHEIISEMAGQIFNEYSFRLSHTLEELVEEVLDCNNCLYVPSSSRNGLLTAFHSKLLHVASADNKNGSIIPVLNDCQELLIPELSCSEEESFMCDNSRFMREETSISC